MTPGDPCELCITCQDAGQRILVESAGSSGFIYPGAGFSICFDVASGRTVTLTQYGCGPSGIDLGDHECLYSCLFSYFYVLNERCKLKKKAEHPT